MLLLDATTRKHDIFTLPFDIETFLDESQIIQYHGSLDEVISPIMFIIRINSLVSE